MPNIIDYIKLRGDLTFEEDPFNEVDNLIFSRISYLPLKGFIKKQEKLKISTIYERFRKSNMKKSSMHLKDDWKFFELIATAKRFRDLVMLKHVVKVSLNLEEQFSAITILLPGDHAYISFGGTDYTFAGWKENFNMSYQNHIPAQKDAVSYMNYIGRRYRGKLILGGHSKGGNLAIYAAAFCKAEIQKRIRRVYSNDAPGFAKEIIESNEYQNVIDKVISYIPQSSIVGRLLFHGEKYQIIKSTQVGIMQHHPYSWQVNKNKFVKMKKLTGESHFAEKTIQNWIDSIEPERREKFFDTILDILVATDAKKLTDLGPNWIKSASTLLKKYKGIDEESKQVISQTLDALADSAKNQILDSFAISKRNEKKKYFSNVTK